MTDSLRTRLIHAGERLRAAAFNVGVLNRTAVLKSLTPAGVFSFARASRGQKAGPHLAVMLHARNKPDRTAVIDVGGGDRREFSFGAFDIEINQLAHALLALGVQSGDRVGVMLPNSATYLITQQALLRMGASAVQIGYRLKAPEIAYILGNSTPKVVLFHADYTPQMTGACAQLDGDVAAPKLVVCDGRPDRPEDELLAYRDIISVHDGRNPPAKCDSSRAGVIIYTSGTTGKPKGASRDMGGVGLDSVFDFVDMLGMRHSDRHLVVCPLYHSAAPAFASIMLTLGGGLVIMDHFDPEAVLATIERERVTCAFMVPTQLIRLADLPDATRARYDTSSLRWVCSGAAPLATETARRFQQIYGPILYNFYGATETGLVTAAGPDDHAAHPGTVGRLLRGNEVRLLDESGKQVPVGEVGELYVRNSMLVTGYHNNRAATEASMRDGFFSVGDLARVDEHGFYYLESRKHDMVISGGMNIYPREIEDYLHTHENVIEAAVIGVPDPEWGESLKAFVVLSHHSSLTEVALMQFCREGLANYKCPRHIEFLDELPHNPTGKVLKRELRAREARE